EDVAWLETGLQNGIIASGGTVTLPVTVNRFGLTTSGNPYVGELKIVTSDPANPEIVLPLTMIFEDQPVLSISHPLIDLGLTEDTWNLAIGNAGSGILTWEADPVESWIAITPRTGGNATSVELRVNRNNAGFGDVSGTVDVISNGGTQQILVLLENRGNNTAPQSDFTVAPETGRLETTFNFDASITTDDYDPLDSLEFSWRWEAGGDFTDWASSPTATHQYASTGNKQVTVNVRDTNGASRTKARTVQVVANAAPVVNFAFDPPSGTTSDVFTFNAGGTTDDIDSIDSLKFRWKFGSGANFTEWSSDTVITHQFATNANHQVTLEVMDTESAVGTRNRTVSVSQNPAPIANFGIEPSSGTTTTVFQFNAGSSSDNRDPIDSLMFRWRWENGEPWTEWTNDTLASHQYTTNGNKQVTLQVMDTDSAVGERVRSVNVSANPAPNTNFTIDPPSGTTTTVFQFNAGLTNDDTDPIELLEFRWRWEAGGNWTNWSSDTLATHQYTSNGNKTVTLEARDQAGAVGTRSKTVSVSSNPAPTAVFSFDPPTGTPAMTFTFNAGGSSDDTDPIESLQFRWEFGAGNGFTNWSSDTLISHMFSTTADQQVTLQVRDLAGAIGEKQQNVPVVQNQSPNASFNFNPPNGTVTTIFQFDASASTDDFTDLADLEFRWRWTANSGFTAWMNTPLASHQYGSTGFKEVTLEVRDAEGSVGDVNATIEVVENQPPNALFSVTPEVGTTATLFQFDASASTDDVFPLDSLMFRWRWENGTPFTDWSDSPTAEHQYSTDGQKTVTLEVLDPGTLVGSVSDLVLVGAPPVSENEPNDSRQQANPAGHTATVFGEIGVAGDEDDWFAITAPANGKLWYQITNLEANGTPDSRIEESPLFAINELLDAVEITSAFVSHGGSRYIGPGEAATSKKSIVSENRTYYIQIPQYTGHSAQYELRMFFSELNQSDLGEDNDDQVSAEPIAANQFHQARNGFWKNGATKEDQQDWYKLEFAESGVLQYTIENLHNESVANGFVDETIFYGSTTFDFIELTRASVSHGSSRYIGETEIATSGKVGIDKGRTFFLQIPQYVNHAAPYEFQVNFVPSAFADFGENNDQSTMATSISANSENTAQVGYVVSSGQYDEKDWYKPQIGDNGLLQITIENLYSNDSLNGRIAPSKIYLKNILDFNEIETLQINHGGSNNYIGAGETVVSSRIAVSTAEEYFLEVPQYLTDRHQAPYKLTTTITPITISGVPDDNDTSGAADSVDVNSVVNAAIGYEEDDDDWYVLTPSTNGSFQFSVANNHVTGVLGGRIATCLMYDSQLNIIATATVNHGGNNNYIDAAETGTSAVVQVTSSSDYYIRIIRNEQDVAPYTLQTSFSQ
ncbi:MAG: PKD domain-containing protein, partial [Calditrichota bacterium]